MIAKSFCLIPALFAFPFMSLFLCLCCYALIRCKTQPLAVAQIISDALHHARLTTLRRHLRGLRGWATIPLAPLAMFWLLLIAHALVITLAVVSSRVRSAKGVVFLFLISWFCFAAQQIFLLIIYPVTYVFPTVREFCKRNSFALYFSVCTYLMENLIGIKFMFYGDDIQDNIDDLSLVISNHHTAFDWMFLWTFFGRLRTLGILKIVLKYELKHVPFFGWITQVSHLNISTQIKISFCDHAKGNTDKIFIVTLGVQVHIFVT